MTRKSIALDLGIELAGAGIVAAIVWLATLSAATLTLPIWAVVIIATLIIAAVAALVAYVIRTRHLRRTETALLNAQELARLAAETLRAMRDVHRMVGEQLIFGDRHTLLKSTTSYTIDPGGEDRIESRWSVAYHEGHQGRAFTTDDWSSQPPTGAVSCTCQSDEGTSIVPVLVVDEPTNKQFVLYLHPPVGTTPRTLQVRQTWPGLWHDLRKNGRDYVELSARSGLQEGVVHVHIPAAVGTFKWAANGNAAIALEANTIGAQQTLTLTVRAPEPGTKYRADIVRV